MRANANAIRPNLITAGNWRRLPIVAYDYQRYSIVVFAISSSRRFLFRFSPFFFFFEKQKKERLDDRARDRPFTSQEAKGNRRFFFKLK